MILVLQMKKGRPREVKKLAHDHTVGGGDQTHLV